MNITYCDIFARIMSEMLSRLSLKKIKSFGKSMITFLYSKVYTCENNLVAYNTNASPQICIQYRFHIVIIGRFPSLIRDRRLTNPWKKCENASKSKKKKLFNFSSNWKHCLNVNNISRIFCLPDVDTWFQDFVTILWPHPDPHVPWRPFSMTNN